MANMLSLKIHRKLFVCTIHKNVTYSFHRREVVLKHFNKQRHFQISTYNSVGNINVRLMHSAVTKRSGVSRARALSAATPKPAQIINTKATNEKKGAVGFQIKRKHACRVSLALFPWKNGGKLKRGGGGGSRWSSTSLTLQSRFLFAPIQMSPAKPLGDQNVTC